MKIQILSRVALLPGVTSDHIKGSDTSVDLVKARLAATRQIITGERMKKINQISTKNLKNSRQATSPKHGSILGLPIRVPIQVAIQQITQPFPLLTYGSWPQNRAILSLSLFAVGLNMGDLLTVLETTLGEQEGILRLTQGGIFLKLFKNEL